MLKVYQLRRNQNTFEVTLNYKGVGVRVSFVDGNTYNDIYPKCYTNDVFKQRAIEASQMFKNREIVLERSIPEDSDRKVPAASHAAVKKMPNTSSAKPASKTTKQASKTPAKQNPSPKVKDQTPENQNTDTQDTDADGLKKMEFTLAEAIQYIATNYQQQVQTPNEARAFLKEKGIKATIKNG